MTWASIASLKPTNSYRSTNMDDNFSQITRNKKVSVTRNNNTTTKTMDALHPVRQFAHETSHLSSIDLHRLTVKDAVQLTSAALDCWWREELATREQSGNMRRQSNNSFTVITGRGVHSPNGVCKIKNSIRYKLERESYIFHEDAGMFYVYGRKRQY